MKHLITDSELGVNSNVRHLRRATAPRLYYTGRMELRIRQMRKARGLTIQQLAEKAAISKSYISEIETGKKQANARVLDLLARALDCSVIELIEESAAPAEIMEHLRRLLKLSEKDRQTVLQLAERFADTQGDE